MHLCHPTEFRLHALEKPELWKLLVGIELEYRKHGQCIIRNVSAQENLMILASLDKNYLTFSVGLDLFNNIYFGSFYINPSLHDKIRLISNKPRVFKAPDVKQTQNVANLVKINEYTYKELKDVILSTPSINKDAIDGLYRAYKPSDENEVNGRLNLKNEANDVSLHLRSHSSDDRFTAPIAEPKTPPMDHLRRKELIFESCRKIGICSIFHFTRIENIRGIFKNGLMSQQELKPLHPNDRPIFNDIQRIDRHPEANCLSISFPNWQWFYKLRCDYPQQIWAVMILKSSILWELDCAFCQENAASHTVTSVPLEERKTLTSFKTMFTNYPGVSRDLIGIPDNYTIHPQAEVLVFDRIDAGYIKAVYLHPKDEGKLMDYEIGPTKNVEVKFDDRYFKPRCDWEFWKNRNQRLDQVEKISQ